MGLGDKISNTAQEVAGKAEELFGVATHNEDLRAEGDRVQDDAKAKQAREDAKDAAKDVFGK
ncbi:CsbD family protein [Arthrobacter glacialis]|uniref:CsbD family protein n=1 Tax=Arthrobacter glacialis TaxID=1664 RepID=UPI000CD3EF99|nr:CsbD family protein [Arthrobacter glacialis]POH58314.1 CsbD family protein [Arthrobacter glacialis]